MYWIEMNNLMGFPALEGRERKTYKPYRGPFSSYNSRSMAARRVGSNLCMLDVEIGHGCIAGGMSVRGG
jgi:hypothetical protein